MSTNATTADGYVDPNWPNPNGKGDVPIIIYGYTPSFSFAVFAAIWFTLMLLLHLPQTIRYKSWWFIPFSIGLLFEIIGYIARCLSAKKDPYNLNYFIINYFFIVVAPVFLAAGIYTILSALISRLGSKYSFLSPKVIMWFFVLSDAISTITQVIGAALIGTQESKHKDPTFANNILLGGLAYQVFSIGIFIIVAGSFLMRARHAVKERGLSAFVLIFTSATILVYLRTVFRLAETAQGLNGSIQSNEIYFACLEFAPVAAAVLLFAGWHPGRCLGSTVKGTEVTNGATRNVWDKA
ncbi:RTA1 domain-containing protein [Trichoderma barbatum]